jgi:guanosine-3',5'-bis(diphosphate) 3'-pyrophosphohydrolase
MTISGDDLKLLLRALEFSARQHRDQRRKDVAATPYINHPIALASCLANEGQVTDPATLSAALLHDTIEDTEATPEELEREFGDEVLSIVCEVTDDRNLARAVRKRLQIEHAAHISDAAKLIKLADKICNLRDIAENPPTDWSLERRQEYFDWARRVVERLRGVHPGLEARFDEIYARRPVT